MTGPAIARGPALVVGGGILAMAVLAGLVGVMGPGGLLTGTDLDATFRDSLASPEALRWSVAALVVVAVLDLVVAWGVYQLFSPVAPALARWWLTTRPLSAHSRSSVSCCSASGSSPRRGGAP